MTNTKFTRYFKKSLIKEGIGEEIPQLDDASTFAGSFEDENVAPGIEDEVANASIAPEQRAELLKLADKYAENINRIILPTLRHLHDDIVSGTFATIAPDVKGISGINEDLASLSESLRGRVRDAVIKSDQDNKK